jgi:hypothetical protein
MKERYKFSIVLVLLASLLIIGCSENTVQYSDIRIPPHKPLRLVELEEVIKKRGLFESELEEFTQLNNSRESLWSEQPMASEFLELVEGNKEQYLTTELMQRNLSSEYISEYIADIKQKMPSLLK